MKRFKDFIGEGLLAAMKPKPEDDIENGLSKLSIFSRIDTIHRHNLDKKFYPSDIEIKNELDKLSKPKPLNKFILRHNLDNGLQPSTSITLKKITLLNKHKLDKKFYPIDGDVDKAVDDLLDNEHLNTFDIIEKLKKYNLDKKYYPSMDKIKDSLSGLDTVQKVDKITQNDLSYELLDGELDVSNTSYFNLYDYSGYSNEFYNKYKTYITNELTEIDEDDFYETCCNHIMSSDIPQGLENTITTRFLKNGEMMIIINNDGEYYGHKQIKTKDEAINYLYKMLATSEEDNSYLSGEEIKKFKNDYNKVKNNYTQTINLVNEIFTMYVTMVKNNNGQLSYFSNYDEIFGN